MHTDYKLQQVAQDRHLRTHRPQNSPPSEPLTICRPGFRFLWLYHFPDFSRRVYLGSGRPIRKNKAPQNYKKFRRQFCVQIIQYYIQRNDWQQIDQPWQLRRRNKRFLSDRNYYSIRSIIQTPVGCRYHWSDGLCFPSCQHVHRRHEMVILPEAHTIVADCYPPT